MRKIVVIACILFSLASLAAAQMRPAGNVFFGYSYYNTNLSSIDRANANGWEASLEGKVVPWVGIVADFSGHYGSQNFVLFCPGGPCSVNQNINEHNVLFGPRVWAPMGKVRPFAEAMIGVGHVNANAAGTDTAFATALGVGFDYRLIPTVAWRFQGDYVHTRFFGTGQDNARLSTGIVFRF